MILAVTALISLAIYCLLVIVEVYLSIIVVIASVRSKHRSYSSLTATAGVLDSKSRKMSIFIEGRIVQRYSGARMIEVITVAIDIYH